MDVSPRSLSPSVALACAALAGVPAPGAAQQSDARTALGTLYESTWEAILRLDPEFASEVGDLRFQRQWTDRSPDATNRLRDRLRAALDSLGAIDREELDARGRVDYDVLEDFARTVASAPAAEHVSVLSSYGYTPISQMGGVHQSIASTLDAMPRRSVSDYEDIVARLAGVAAPIDGAIETLRGELRAGVVLPAAIFGDVLRQVRALGTGDPAESPLTEAFRDVPAAIPEGERARLARAGEAAYREHALPAFRRLAAFVEEEYAPAARSTIALGDLDGGEAWYAYKVRTFTTTDMSPREIHELGLREVARIRAEMEAVVEEAGFAGTFAEFADFLRTDPRFYFEDADALVAAYRNISKRADPELVALFGRLPRMPYGVKEIPAYSAPTNTTAYYTSGAHAAGRPAWYNVNTYDLPSRPAWEMEALSLHEAVPGHHLQISLAQELEDLPELRRHLPYNAFVEGWALYAETLGYDMGFYEDPYSRYGQLSYQMWRAVRLVVDTGMHAFGWPRERAIAFFAENSGKPEHDITVEIDRYIAWPGQALGYMIGKLKIEELRRRAEERLGDDFDVREFHDRVLENGAVPLGVLERHIDAWLEEATGSS
jgi:uncharacterized protein (DUF885 family)